jgi:hypothetical protein
MKKISKRTRLTIIVGALVAMLLAYGVVAYAWVPDPPVGFAKPAISTVAWVPDPPVGSPIKL